MRGRKYIGINNQDRGLNMVRFRAIMISLLIIALFFVSGCASLTENVERPRSYAYADTRDTRFGRLFREEREVHPDQSGFLVLDSGLDAFVARAVLAQGAERSIDAQYYLYHDDLVGRLFTDQLLKAAERGAFSPSNGSGCISAPVRC